MEADVARAARPALRSADWDVPVRLVADVPTGETRGHSAGASAVTLRAAPRVPLPGLVGVTLTVREIDGEQVLTDVAPLVGAATPGGGATEPRSLGDVLDGLRDADGPVPVLAAGTPFARAVLGALAAVPAGERRTYAELAAMAGSPRAVRAAASVMSRNRVPLVLPCHRIVPSAGGVGRYGWGEGVKRALLDAEAAA